MLFNCFVSVKKGSELIYFIVITLLIALVEVARFDDFKLVFEYY